MQDFYTTPTFLSLCLGYGLVFAFAVTYAVRRLRGDLFYLATRPDALFMLMFAVVHGLVPILKLLDSYERYQAYYDGQTHFWAMLITCLYAFGVLLGTWAVRRRPADEVGNVVRASGIEMVVFGLLILIPAAYAAWYIRGTVEEIGLERFLTDRIGYGAQLRQWELLANALAVVPSMGLLWGYGNREKLTLWGWLVVAVGVGAVAVLASSAGARNSVFIMLATLALVFIYTLRDMSKGRLALLASVFLGAGMVLALLGEYRKEIAIGSTYETEFTTHTVVRSIDGGFGNHENILWLIEHDFEMQWGSTYLAGFTNFVPRTIWPDKPLGGGPRLRNMIRPGSYDIWRRGLSSYTTGAVTEAFMNFRWIGMVIVGFFHGLILALAGRLAGTARTSHGVVLACYIIVSVAVTLVYSEFLGWLGRTVIVSILVAISAAAHHLSSSSVRNARRVEAERAYSPLRPPPDTQLRDGSSRSSS